MNNPQEFLEQIQSSDPDVRYTAWRSAGPQGAPAVRPLADLLVAADKGVAKAAQGALQTIVHYAGRPGATAEAQAVSTELLQVAGSGRPRGVRAEALHWLGFVGDEGVVSGLAQLLGNPEVREDARLALERIPGDPSQQALQEALRTAPADFRPNLEQSLYNRSLTPATVGAPTAE